MRTVHRATRAVAAAALLALAAACGGDAGAPRELRLFVWSDYVDAELLAEFERESGARVVESNYSSNEEMRAKLQAGGTGWDLVCPTDYAVVQLVGDGLLQPLDPAKLPGLVHLAPRFRSPSYDPEHRWSVPFHWGVTGIGYDATRVAEPPRTWRAFFDAAASGALGKVSLLDDPREVLGAALLALGRSPNSRDAEEVAAARDLVAAARANVERFDSDTGATSVLQGQVALAHGWSGQFAAAHAEDARIAFVVPQDGTFAFVDNWAIPKGAQDADLAHAFVDWCLRPEVAAKIVRRRHYASTNAGADALLPAETLRGIGYADGGGAKLWWVEDLGPAGDLYAEVWRELKSDDR